MSDEDLILELDKTEAQVEEKAKIKNRFEKLSEKVIAVGKEKEEAEAKLKAEAERASLLAKERDFYKDFSVYANKFPGASEYQTKIWDKVKNGYSTVDAMVAVLNQEGKLGVQTNSSTPTPPPPPPQNAAGGSATTSMPDKDKEIDSMSIAEKLAALKDAEKRGDISFS